MAKPISTMSRIRYSAFWVWETNLTGKQISRMRNLFYIYIYIIYIYIYNMYISIYIYSIKWDFKDSDSSDKNKDIEPIRFHLKCVWNFRFCSRWRVFLASSVVMVMLRLSRTIRVPTDKEFVESTKASPEDEEKCYQILTTMRERRKKLQPSLLPSSRSDSQTHIIHSFFCSTKANKSRLACLTCRYM